MFKFLRPFNSIIIIGRNKSNRRYNWRDEGIQYPGFKYYPRTPDFKDPPYEPSKLFRVRRIKKLKGVPFYELKILQDYGLAEQKPDVVIIKNIPENNQRLWKVKHLIEIVPITFPNGFPKDSNGTMLKENGELLVNNSLKISEEKLMLTEDFQTDVKRMDGDTLRRDSRKKWLNAWQ